MGEAKRRGTREQRVEQAIVEGRRKEVYLPNRLRAERPPAYVEACRIIGRAFLRAAKIG
jgi:hypothetical protein